MFGQKYDLFYANGAVVELTCNAQLWDICKQKNTRWFILTNYTDWVFGCFSRGQLSILRLVLDINAKFLGWTRGFVTEVTTADAKNPTVLQCLLYWLTSSMDLPNVEGFYPPEVCGEPEYAHEESPCLVYDLMSKDPRASLLLSLLNL